MIKAAIIGMGVMGYNHLRIYKELEEIELVGVADVNEESLARAKRVYQTNTYTNYLQMLEKEQPEIVSITLPSELHCEIGCEVMKRGIHVLVEKPLALTIEEGEKLIEVAKEQGVKLMVGHVERFNPAITEIKKRIDQEQLGRIFQIHAQRLSPFPRRIRDVGVILDLATHDLDAMGYILNSSVTRVFAETAQKAHHKCEDLLSGLMRFSCGTIGVLNVNWLTPTKVRRLTVVGERGVFMADYLTQDVFWYKNADVADDWGTLSIFRGVREGDMVKLHFQKKEPLRAELESFIDCVKNDTTPYVTGEDGLRAVTLALRLMKAGETNELDVL